ncbi:hypothetical protein [Pelagicoccus sp. SDUM812002]|uniref:hypothetical protein n=1 Tax=Pelagicoccus sp. SDUM812002 TaxID=3041266 RepID=UPI00280D9CA0|nr:hypothetical protein [Pelagicoccus sp. SDUM812002]MDQ8186398.1 hypothetical protein [Pelagicoccus sp. SDUM812002]
MSKLTIIPHYLLAIMLVVFGLNKFLNFMPMPEPTGQAADFMEAITGSFIWPTLGILYVLCGILLAINKAVGLATVILAPLAFCALMYHITLDLANIPGAAIFAVLLVITMIGNAGKYKALLS